MFAKLDFKIPSDLNLMDNAEPYLQFTKKQKYTRNLNPKYTSTPTEILSISNTIIKSTLSLLPQSIFDIELPKVFLIRVVYAFFATE